MAKSWASLGTAFAFLAFVQGLANAFLPSELQRALRGVGRRIFSFFFNYVDVKIDEYDGANMNELFSAVQLHLSESAEKNARSVNLALPKNASALTYSLAKNERLKDTFQGAHVWWEFRSGDRKQPSSPWQSIPDEKRSLHLRLRKQDREKILSSYVQHILAHAKDIKIKHRDRLLYTNMKASPPWSGHGKVWSKVPFKHPSTFETLALDPQMKKKITEDLTDFAGGEEFYKRAGRSWKRGYLLHGPPGTGKSSMIAAMANFLQYDVYDLELTEVKSNAALRNLLLHTSNKSIIVIEDIDCSLDLSTRKKSKKSKEEKKPSDTKTSSEGDEKVTLSGLLNFTDGLWSCCGTERIFVFTTNHVEKVDPALLRSGRMDMHIHLSYCTFEAFKVLAKNYLGIETHEMFKEVQEVMEEEGVEMTPADVSEVMTRKKRDVEEALRCLLTELRESKAKRKEKICEDDEEQEAEEKKEVEVAKTEEKKEVDVAKAEFEPPETAKVDT